MIIVNANSIVQYVIQINKFNNDKCQCDCKKYHTCKKVYSWNRRTCICENSRYLKSIFDVSVIVCDEIINITISVTINLTNTMSTNVNVVNSDDKVDYYIFFYVFISGLITIYDCQYLLSICKT